MFLILIFNQIILEYSCFIMLCYFLLFGKVNHYPCTYICSALHFLPVGHQGTWSRVPFSVHRFLLIIHFVHSTNSIYVSIPIVCYYFYCFCHLSCSLKTTARALFYFMMNSSYLFSIWHVLVAWWKLVEWVNQCHRHLDSNK